MKQFTHLGLFEGIGGFSLAARWMGWETVAWCEWNPFGQKVLRHHFPEAIGHGDITKTDFTPYANTIDILTGGFPCQPYSMAGKRKGKEDERHLWPEMLRAIREVKPRWIVGENVSGLLNWNGGLVVDEIKANLEAAGYTVLPPFVLPACAVNAPHRRDRVWIIAHANSGTDLRTPGQDAGAGKEERLQQRDAIREFDIADSLREFSSDPNGAGLQKERPEQQAAGIEQYGKLDRDAANTYGGAGETQREGSLLEEPGRKGKANGHTHGSDRTDWTIWPTVAPLCTGNDGVSTWLDVGTISFSKWRAESVKAGGNAIVPQVAFQIFKAIQQYELMISEPDPPTERSNDAP